MSSNSIIGDMGCPNPPSPTLIGQQRVSLSTIEGFCCCQARENASILRFNVDGKFMQTKYNSKQ